jgi:hypothetical protein
MIMKTRAPLTGLSVGRPRRIMAALAPLHVVFLTTALIVTHGFETFMIVAVPFIAIGAIPLFFRDSRTFNGACYVTIALLVLGACFGGFLFLPAILPLLLATPPTLGAPVPQVSVAAVLVAATFAITAVF